MDFPKAYGNLIASAQFRTEPEDFQVDEVLGFEPAGQGEHVLLRIRKRGENTAWVAEKIAELAGVKVVDIGYCGRKDRHAVTTQWFSVCLPKHEAPNWEQLSTDSIQVLQVARHSHKLRRGDHESNHFIIRLRDLKTDNRESFEEKLKKIFLHGVPNYYGEQRFGHSGNNLLEAERLLVDRKMIRDQQKRSLYLSSARSYLFNLVLAARVRAECWQIPVEGEPEDFPSAPLWGRGRSLSTGALAILEGEVLQDWQSWCNGLEHAGLKQERRSTVLLPKQTGWRWDNLDLILNFALGSGEFATTILAELADLHSAAKFESASL